MENNTNNWPVGDHLENFNNPHEVTKAQVGLGNVENVRQYSELNPPPNHINTVCGKGPDANGDIDLVKGDVNLGKVDNVKQYSEKNPPPYPVTSVNGQTGAVNIALPDTSGLQTAINTHTANVCNPHQVTKDQIIGLENVWDKNNLRMEKGLCDFAVTPSELGIRSKAAWYTLVGDMCFVDFYIAFDGTGTTGKNEIVKLKVMPFVPAIISSQALVYVNKPKANGIGSSAAYITTDSDLTLKLYFNTADSTQYSQPLCNSSIQFDTSIRGQFFYRIRQEEGK